MFKDPSFVVDHSTINPCNKDNTVNAKQPSKENKLQPDSRLVWTEPPTAIHR